MTFDEGVPMRSRAASAALVLTAAVSQPSSCETAPTTTRTETTQRIEVQSGGDSSSTVVKINADNGVCWAGTVAGAPRSGCGDAAYPAAGEGGVVATIVKTDGAGGVSVRIVVDGHTVDRAVSVRTTTLTVRTGG
jgi:hypothetical protein